MREKLSLIVIASLLILTLAGCDGEAEETPTPAVEPLLSQTVSVSGEVTPETWAMLSVQTGGTVSEVLVEPGDEVAAGDLLVRLDTTDAALAVQEAEANLASAQAELARLQALPRPQDVAAAEQQVEAAEAAVSQVAAEQDRLNAGGIESDIAAAKAQVARAEAAQKEAQIQYDTVRHEVENDRAEKWEREESALRLRAAEQSLQSAELQLYYAWKSAELRRQDVGASVQSAQAQQDVAEAQLEKTEAGALEEEIALAEISVAQAQIELDAAQMQMERCELRAPFSGAIGEVDVREGEQVTAGTPVVTLGDLSTLQVETTDLDEIDVARIEVGQQADVSFDAFPEKVFTGRITRINPMAEPSGGGVNYPVIIELEELDPAVRWGMTAFVDVSVGQ